MEHIQAPDFPTGGIINGRAGVVQAYRTGRGRIYVRGKAHVEETRVGGKRLSSLKFRFSSTRPG